MDSHRRFQSTHPVWGATFVRKFDHCPGRFQSTHPVWGATPLGRGRDLIHGDFNPRTPCGVRQAHFNHMEEGIEFQSTHPVWGATQPLQRMGTDDRISIHAPRVGCDQGRRRGPRQGRGFQSTHPVWGATTTTVGHNTDGQFQSTHPVWGATPPPPWQCPNPAYFNPRTPCGVRPTAPVPRRKPWRISIHAPRVGCDL